MAYWGQAKVEYAVKNMKNPFHLALRPQYHWTSFVIRSLTLDISSASLLSNFSSTNTKISSVCRLLALFISSINVSDASSPNVVRKGRGTVKILLFFPKSVMAWIGFTAARTLFFRQSNAPTLLKNRPGLFHLMKSMNI